MQQRKFTSWHFAFLVVVFVVFASSEVMAASSTCSTVANASGQFITVTAVTNGGFPLNFKDNTADTQNYCGNATMDNYPCTVFRYRTVSNGFNASHLYATIPVCPDDQLKVLNYSYYPLCKPGSREFADILTCNMKSIFISDGGGSGSSTHDFWIAVYTPPGKTVELGMNNMVLAKSGSPTEFFACNSEGSDPYSSGTYPSGILGPGCLLNETTCKPNPYAAQTTNICLPNVNGQVLKLDVVNKEIEAVYKCPTGDTGCIKPLCDPETESCESIDPPLNQCIKQKTYEVEAKFYDESGNLIDGGSAFKITDVGGTVEEAIGYFVVSDSCPTTTCISGLAGRTICTTKPCP